jgi:phenylacetic acid degradation operon negative regulatory protein
LGDFGYSKAAARIALSRLVRKRFLAPTKEGRRVFFEMTPTLVALLEEGERRIFSFGRTDPETSSWTLLSYSIPEGMRGERDRLRKRLAFLGFVSLNDGFWFSTRDGVSAARSTIAQLRLDRYVDVFVGLPAREGDAPDIIARAWKGHELNRLYEEFLAEYEPYRDPRALQRLSDREAFVIRTLVVHAFRRFPQLDPEFPDPTLQQLRREAITAFDDVYGGLADLAQSYFDRLATT